MVDLRQLDQGAIKTNSGTQPGANPGKVQTSAAAGNPQETSEPAAETKSSEGQTDKQELNPDEIQDYRKFLEQQGIKESQLNDALDALITQGYFTWSFKLFGKVECEFRTRPQWVESVVIDKMEELSPRTYGRFTNTLNMYNLSGSLAQYGETRFDPEDPEGLDQVLEYISRLPSITIKRLVSQLVIFDRIVAVATSDWALENFQ